MRGAGAEFESNFTSCMYSGPSAPSFQNRKHQLHKTQGETAATLLHGQPAHLPTDHGSVNVLLLFVHLACTAQAALHPCSGIKNILSFNDEMRYLQQMLQELPNPGLATFFLKK